MPNDPDVNMHVVTQNCRVWPQGASAAGLEQLKRIESADERVEGASEDPQFEILVAAQAQMATCGKSHHRNTCTPTKCSVFVLNEVIVSIYLRNS